MVQRTVLKVKLSCDKCKKKLLKSVSGVYGVDKIEIDGTKDTLTVTGDANPYEIILRTRKVIKCAEVVTIGPPPVPPKDGNKPAENKPAAKKEPEVKIEIPRCCSTFMPCNCGVCRPLAVVHMIPEPAPCTIM